MCPTVTDNVVVGFYTNDIAVCRGRAMNGRIAGSSHAVHARVPSSRCPPVSVSSPPESGVHNNIICYFTVESLIRPT